MIGTVVGSRYCILRQLGEGGMGVVYEAVDNRAGRRVALKVLVNRGLVTDREARMRFEREALAARAIDTPHIVQVLDAGVDTDQGLPFLVMELMSGADLEQLIQHLGPLPPDLVLRIAAQTCVGLAKAHAAGVVHRDIKPANLYLARQDSGEVIVKIADFGIAKLSLHQMGGSQDQALTQAGGLLGSPLFMSPEQARGLQTVDHRTDLWSLGAVLYQGLTGRAPHHGIDSVGQLLITICSEPARNIQDVAPWVPLEIAAIVHRALAIDADQRFASATEMLEALVLLLPGGSRLNEWMLAPLPFETRASIAPRMQETPPSSRAPAPSSASAWPSSRVHPSSTAPQVKDVDATQQALTRTARGVRSRGVPLGIGALLVLGGLGAWKMMEGSSVGPAALGGPSLPSALGTANDARLDVASRALTPKAALGGPLVTPVDGSAVRAPVGPPPKPGRHPLVAPRDNKTNRQIARPDPDNLGTRRIIRRSLE